MPKPLGAMPPPPFELHAKITYLPLDAIGLYECGVCHGVVQEAGVESHTEWHADERLRTWSGF
jgi:hypothetical protein